MGLPLTGPLSLADIQTTFVGGSNPISMSEYYAGGTYVPSGTVGYPGGVSTAIPASGAISIGNFYGSENSVQAYYAIVGGGGGGGQTVGWEGGGGGGAGGLLYNPSSPVTLTSSYAVVVGNGGAFQTKGGDSSFIGLTAFGGGAGGYNATTGYSGQNGGSGGGGTNAGGGVGTAGQGFAGGTGPVDSSGGGGGGAGGVGANGVYYNTAVVAGGAGVNLTVAGQSYVLSRGGQGAGFNRFGSGQRGAAGPFPGGGGGGNASVGTSDTAGKNGAVLIWYNSAVVRASGGTVYQSGGVVLHVFTSNGTFALL